MNSSSQELLLKALTALADKYDPDNDCFFVVVTKEGKLPHMEEGQQIIIGEMNLKTLVPFIVEAVNQVSCAVHMSPHDFVARYLTGAMLAEERSLFYGFEMDLGEEEGLWEDEDEEEDDEEGDLDVATFVATFVANLGDKVH